MSKYIYNSPYNLTKAHSKHIMHTYVYSHKNTILIWVCQNKYKRNFHKDLSHSDTYIQTVHKHFSS